MSIDRQLDAYFEHRQTHPVVEVVPDHPCQDFTPAPGVSILARPARGVVAHMKSPADPGLEAARALVENVLRP